MIENPYQQKQSDARFSDNVSNLSNRSNDYVEDKFRS